MEESQQDYKVAPEQTGPDSGKPLVLVTGASGYVGGRLVPILLEKGYPVRCLIRPGENLESRGWKNVHFVIGDVLDFESLRGALKDVDLAYYLIHSMAESKDFHSRDLAAARNFALASREAGVSRILYLSGLGQGKTLSPHLRSRQDTGRTLGETGIPVTEFRAAQVIGSGSVSFEMIRYLTERLPVILAPWWIDSMTQPVSIRDVLYYLSTAPEVPETQGEIIEIGARDSMTYRELIRTYARVRGLRRPMLVLPLLSPAFFAFWVNLITPIPRTIARPLLEGIKNDVVITACGADAYFQREPLSVEEAIREALEESRLQKVDTYWSLPHSSAPPHKLSEISSSQREGLFIDEVSLLSTNSREALFRRILCIGGDYGWPSLGILWKIRGWLDQLFGGSGLLRGRRCHRELQPGDPLDFFMVEEIRPGELLLLRTNFKMPGQGWLAFRLQEEENGTQKGTRIFMQIFFDPKGMGGLLYWKALLPIHRILFGSTLKKLDESCKS